MTKITCPPISNLQKILKSKAAYHPTLKIIAYKEKGDETNFSSKRMFGYLCEKSEEDNKKLQELNSQTKYLTHLPHLQGFFMEKFGGYKKI
ncbi:MAG: hypothetical protein AABX88_01235 [Nanoarchaeota archaeon]